MALPQPGSFRELPQARPPAVILQLEIKPYIYPLR
jgi:hypothetical protein